MSHVVGGHRLLDHGAFAFGCLDILELLLDFRNASVSEFARALVLSLALRVGELDAQVIEFGLKLLGVRKLVLLSLPSRGEIGGALFERSQLLL